MARRYSWTRERKLIEGRRRELNKKHLDNNRAKAIQMSRARALSMRLRTLVPGNNIIISDDGAEVWVTGSLVWLNGLRRRLKLQRKVTNRYIVGGDWPGQGRRIFGMLVFQVSRDFNKVPLAKKEPGANFHV